MNVCPETDALVTVAQALDWQVDDGLRHLQMCSDCRATLDVLHSTQAALTEVAPVDGSAIAGIAAAIRAEARAEKGRTQRAARRVAIAETVLAAIAAPVVLISSGVPLGGAGTALVTSLLGAAFLLYGRRAGLRV